jgi:transcriptional regulator with XRE-family HTH domain
MLASSASDEGVSVNQALRSAMMAAGMHQIDLASHLAVDPKTVERWLAGRVPHRRNRAAVAELLNRSEDELWPDADATDRRHRLGGEVRTVYPHRWAVPREVWLRHFEHAEDEISILVYSGLFLAEDGGILRLLGGKARSGVSVRMVLGDPDSAQVVQRGNDERVGDSMANRIRNALTLLRPLAEADGVQLRLHDTILYNSLYRSDDELFVNPHIYGVAAPNAPVLHLRQVDDAAMVATYLESFERVWSVARSV